MKGYDVLRELYHGNLRPSDRGFRKDTDFAITMEAFTLHEKWFRENLGEEASKRFGNVSSWAYKLIFQSRNVPVRRGAPLFLARRAHLLTTRKRVVVWPSATVRSPRGMRPLPGPAGNDCGHSRCVWNRAVRRPVPYASEKLPLAAFRCLRGT